MKKQLTVNLYFLGERGACSSARILFRKEVVERFGREDFDVLLSYVVKRIREIEEDNYEAFLLAQPEFCESMLKAGTPCDINNYYALDEAAKKGYIDSIKLLVEAGAKINESNALNSAIQHSQHKLIMFLFELGAKPECWELEGYLKCFNPEIGIVKKLIECGEEMDLDSDVLVNAYETENFEIIKAVVEAYEDKEEVLEVAEAEASIEVEEYVKSLLSSSESESVDDE